MMKTILCRFCHHKGKVSTETHLSSFETIVTQSHPYQAIPTLPAEVQAAIDSGTWKRNLSLEADKAIAQAEARHELEFRGARHG